MDKTRTLSHLTAHYDAEQDSLYLTFTSQAREAIAEEAGDECRRGLHAAAMLGQISTPNVSDSDRDQSDDREQIDQGGGPEGEAGIHRVSIQSGFQSANGQRQ